MSLRMCLILVLLVVDISLSQCLYEGEQCEPGEDGAVPGSLGTCRYLVHCTPLLALVQAAGTTTRVRDVLRRAKCGFEDDQPLVCCIPTSQSSTIGGAPFTNDPPTSLRPQSSAGDHTGSDNAGSDRASEQGPNARAPADLTRHPNARLLPSICGPIEDDRIWGGNKTGLYEFPWMVLLAYETPRESRRLSCGGTLVSARYVLTAAHCVSHLGRMRLVGVLLGEHNTRTDPDCERIEGTLSCAPPAQNVSIAEVIPHPGYAPQTLYDDIALLRLAEPADFTKANLKPICLPITRELASLTLVGEKATVAGWGATEDGPSSDELLKADLPVVSNSDCEAAYSRTTRIYWSQLCAGGVSERDSCGGDSGGPLMFAGNGAGAGGVRLVQHGIVGFGEKRCGAGRLPGVYTRVANYVQWILDNISD